MPDGPTTHGLLLGRRLRPVQGLGFASRVELAPEHGGELVTYQGDAPILTFAPTGAGKTAGPVVCNARTYPGQLICLDVKGEAHRLSAEHRKRMGQEIYVLDLRDRQVNQASLNPLDLAVRQGDDLTAIARALAAEMIERQHRPPGRDLFWVDWAETMLTAGFAHMLHHEPEEKRRVSWLFDLYNSSNPSYDVATLIDETPDMNRATYAGWRGYMGLPDRETGPCVLSSTTAHLRLFESDLIRRATDTTSIDLDGLLAGKPMSIYITVPPHRIAAYAPILRMWLSGLLNLLTTREEAPALPTLVLVDEAAQLGKVDSFITAMTLMRGYGVKLWTFWQAASQLEVYGSSAKTMMDNAGVVQIFGLRNYRAANEIATLLGGVTPEAVLRLAADEQMVAIEGRTPEVCRQVRYYSDALFDNGPEPLAATR